MSRIAKKPLVLPSGVDFKITNGVVNVKGSQGNVDFALHNAVDVNVDGKNIMISLKEGQDAFKAMVGTTCVLLKNMITGVSTGFKKVLQLKGVGYRAKAAGKNLELTLGFSHPVKHPIPEGIKIETPSNTEIIVSGMSKEKVGQVAAEIRAYRPPESYKGKGVRYADEYVAIKETKKKK